MELSTFEYMPVRCGCLAVISLLAFGICIFMGHLFLSVELGDDFRVIY